MTTFENKFLSYFLLLSLFLLPIFNSFAQELNAENIPTTTKETVDIPKETQWYESERISGKIEVGDFVVGPGKIEVRVKPGEVVTHKISVTNRISENRIFSLEVEDITGSSDGGSSVSLSGDERGPYSLRDYISFPENSFELELGERAWIPITISIPKDAEPGGFYGSVLVSTLQAGAQGDLVPRSPIIARVGSLFFVTVEGDAFVEGETKEISTPGNKWWYEKGPIELGILYENTGSLHVNPYGEISVTNMFGEEVGYMELEPWFVLPKSLRIREFTWDREVLLGRYSVTAKVNRGYEDIVDEVQTAFWVLPWKIIVGVLGGLFLFIFAVRFFFSTFEFKRKGS